MNIESLQCEVTRLESKLHGLQSRLSERKRELGRLLSECWIKEHRVTRHNLIRPEDMKTWVGHVDEWREILGAKYMDRDYASWKGTIYATADLVANGLRRDDPPGRVEHVPGYAEWSRELAAEDA